MRIVFSFIFYSMNSEIHSSFKILLADKGWCKNSWGVGAVLGGVQFYLGGGQRPSEGPWVPEGPQSPLQELEVGVIYITITDMSDPGVTMCVFTEHCNSDWWLDPYSESVVKIPG